MKTWLGHGIDYSKNNALLYKQAGTPFDDYCFIFYIFTLFFTFACGYKFWSLGCIFMFAGVGGGVGNNIQYLWALMMVMTCVRFFYENRDKPEIYEEEDYDKEEVSSPQPCPMKRN